MICSAYDLRSIEVDSFVLAPNVFSSHSLNLNRTTLMEKLKKGNSCQADCHLELVFPSAQTSANFILIFFSAPGF